LFLPSEIAKMVICYLIVIFTYYLNYHWVIKERNFINLFLLLDLTFLLVFLCVNWQRCCRGFVD